MRDGRTVSGRARTIAKLLLAIEVAGIVWLVLNPSSATPSGAVYRVSNFLLAHGAPSWAASTTGWEYLLNVALFVPLGLLSALIWDRVWLEGWVVLGFVGSASLELTQYFFLDGRSATISDVSSNTIGMFLGAAAGTTAVGILERRRARSTPRAARLRLTVDVRHRTGAQGAEGMSGLSVAAVVFDLDGVLVDSEPLWQQGFADVVNAFCVEQGRDDPRLTREDMVRFHGGRARDTVRTLVEEQGLGDRLTDDTLAALTERVVDDAAGQLSDEVAIGASVEVARRLHEDGVRMAVASSSAERFIRRGGGAAGPGGRLRGDPVRPRARARQARPRGLPSAPSTGWARRPRRRWRSRTPSPASRPRCAPGIPVVWLTPEPADEARDRLQDGEERGVRAVTSSLDYDEVRAVLKELRVTSHDERRRHRYAVVVAGGSGTRLWPLSRQNLPKQMQALMSDKTLIAETVDRLRGVVPVENIFISTTGNYLETMRGLLPDIAAENFITEPVARGTSAAFALIAERLHDQDPQAVVFSLASDHAITEVEKFQQTLDRSFTFIEEHPRQIAMVGIRPDRADTGLGYIKVRGVIQDDPLIYEAEKFVEKPTHEVAEKYVESGEYFWNAAYYCFYASTLLEAYEDADPRLTVGGAGVLQDRGAVGLRDRSGQGARDRDHRLGEVPAGAGAGGLHLERHRQLAGALHAAQRHRR